MPEFTADELKNKSPEELAVLGERNHPLSAEGILIKNELQKRLISSTHKTTKRWYEKPLGILLIGIVASLLAWLILHYYGLA